MIEALSTRIFLSLKIYYCKQKLNTITPSSVEKISSQALDRRVRSAFEKLFVGADKPGALPLDERYWFETKRMTLHVNGKAFSGYLYIGRLAQETMDGDEKERSRQTYWKETYSSQMSFEQFMNQIGIPAMSKWDKKRLEDFLRGMEYLNKNELPSVAANLSNGKLLITPTLKAYLTKNKGVEADQLPSLKKHIHNAAFPKSNPSITAGSGHTLIIAKTLDDKWYIAPKITGCIQHSSFTKGLPLKEAFILTTEKSGQIKAIHLCSGHYRPSKEHLISILESLTEAGFDITKIKFYYEFFAKEESNASSIYEQAKIQMAVWREEIQALSDGGVSTDKLKYFELKALIKEFRVTVA